MTQPLPAWAGDGKRFVPTHLNSGTTRSSFETGEETPSSFRRTSVSGPSLPGSSFGAPKTLRKPADADLPPSESIHINRTKDLSEISFKSESKPAAAARDAAPAGTAVLVFGFPAGMTMAVLQHFSQFGTILENSSNSSSATPNTSGHPPAIECGRNWLRLRYRDRHAAERAANENGRMLPGEFVVGAVLADGSDVPAPSAFSSLLVDESDTSAMIDVSSILDKSLAGPVTAGPVTAAPTPTSAGSTATASAGSTATVESDPTKLTVKTPATSLFKHQEKHIVPHPHLQIHTPEALKKELSWVSWGAKKLRETVFGWDDL